MGIIVSVECECGYPDLIPLGYSPGVSGGSLRVGNGVRGSGLYFPSLCEDCSEVVAVNLGASPWQCPKCKSERVVPYFPETAHGDKQTALIGIRCGLIMEDGKRLTFELYEDATYACPECGEARLRFEKKGYWD